jgi:hypothetical protein
MTRRVKKGWFARTWEGLSGPPTLAAQAGQGGPVRIAVTMRAKTPLAFKLEDLTAALQTFYDTYFQPVWGYPVLLYVAATPAASDWQIVFLDNADVANALGYHELTLNGQPISKIFLQDILKVKGSVSVTACHELCEMVIDPLANLWSMDNRGTLHAYEMCDAVEEDTFEVQGFTMSNFLHPAWFEDFVHPAGTKFDHLGLLKAPFTLRHNGYEIVVKNGKIRNVFGSVAKRKRFAEEDRRGHRSEYRRGPRVYRGRSAKAKTRSKK